MCRLGLEAKSCVSGCHVRYLMLHAFLKVLQKKQSRYREVLKALRADIQSAQYAKFCRQTMAALQPSRSPEFEAIQY